MTGRMLSLAGPLLMLSSALLFTGLNVLIKILGPEFRVWDISFIRFSGGLVILCAVLARNGNPFNGRNIPLLILRGCTGSVAFLCITTAIRIIPISTALVLFYSFPAFAAIFAAIIFKEKISRTGILCLLSVMTGIMILFDFQLEGGVQGQALSIIGGVFAGLTVTLIKALRTKNGPAVIYLYFCTMGLIVIFPPFITSPVFPHAGGEWLICGGIVATSLTAQLLMNQGFFYCRSWEGGLFMSTEVIFTALVGIIFFHETAGWRFITGTLLIFGSVITLNITNARSAALLRNNIISSD